MKILALETSCDETAAAIVEDGKKVLSSVIVSQATMHAKTGGVVPEVAAREHAVKCQEALLLALDQAKLALNDIDALAATVHPGLLSSLIIGFASAQTLAILQQKSFIPVNHIVGHVYANWLDLSAEEEVQFPILVLTVSGGHNQLMLMRNHLEMEIIGQTRDDSAGEAFDKIARMLGIGYPGGPAISKMGQNGDSKAFDLPRAMLNDKTADFSFSGLKTAVLRIMENEMKESGSLSTQFKSDLSASFEECVTDILVRKTLWALQNIQEKEKITIKEIHLAGGVSANSRLRLKMTQAMGSLNQVKLRFQKNLTYCTDNAAMIASAAFHQYQKDPQKFQILSKVLPSPKTIKK